MKKEVPSKELMFKQLQDIKMSEAAKNIIICFVENAGFEYCIIEKQLMTALDLKKSTVESALDELMKIGLVKQQALFGKERTYILSPSYFTLKRPVRRTKEELRNMLKVI